MLGITRLALVAVTLLIGLAPLDTSATPTQTTIARPPSQEEIRCWSTGDCIMLAIAVPKGFLDLYTITNTLNGKPKTDHGDGGTPPSRSDKSTQPKNVADPGTPGHRYKVIEISFNQGTEWKVERDYSAWKFLKDSRDTQYLAPKDGSVSGKPVL